MKNLTAKKVLVAIKNGLTPEDMAEKFEASWDDLEKKIQQIYSEGNGAKAREMIESLKANRKRPRRHKAKEPSTPLESEETTLFIPEEMVPAEQPEATLADLKAEEARLSEEVVNFEIEHKNFSKERRDVILTIRSLQEELSGIKKSLISCKDRYLSACEKADKLAGEMNAVSALRYEKQVALEKVRHAIEEKSVITLYVYDNGTIEAAEAPEFSLEAGDYQEKKTELAERPDCQDLRLRDLDTIARLISITEKADGVKFNLVFENEEVEIAYQIIWDEAHS